MGLLDDLEQEAQRRKASLDEAQTARAAREHVYLTQLDPAMQGFYEYLGKLTGNLAFLKPRTQLQFEIPGYGLLVANVEHEYELRSNKLAPTAREVVLNFHANVATEECPSVEVVGTGKIRTLNGIFQKLRLAAVHEFKKDDSGEMTSAVFRARGKIPLNVSVATDAESAQVRMSFTNFDSLGVAAKAVPAAQFNEALYDEIGRLIAREPNTLFREAISDDYRKQLQQKLQQDNMRRKWETKIAQQQKQDIEKLNREQSLKGKLDKAVKGVKESAPSLLDRMKGIFRKP
jgi:hypothetical protein